MSTEYHLVCFTCKEEGPSFAAGSIAYGYKVWNEDEWKPWLGHREDVGKHEHHDVRVVCEDTDLPFPRKYDDPVHTGVKE